jgi:hypothetical protein
MSKVVHTITFSKKDKEEAKPCFNIPQPHADRQTSKYYKGYLLQMDAGGYFILKPSPCSPTLIREDLPHSIGYALALERDQL